MRIITTLIGILFFGVIFAQTANTDELYQKIVNYYQQNPNRIEFVKNVHKNLLHYDTTEVFFAYAPLKNNNFYLFWSDTAFTLKSGLLYSGEYYILSDDMPEKIRLTKKELKQTMYSRLDFIPAWHCSSIAELRAWLGGINAVKFTVDKYIITTRNYIVEVDALSSRITNITSIIFAMNRTQYNEYHYLQTPDSIENSLRQDVNDFVNAAGDLPSTTLKELDKRKPPNENFEGKQFAFSNLISLNTGSLDSMTKGKYVIYDFFYLSCLPCHKMTGFILAWLTNIDTSKVILVGINPADSEFNMRIEIKNRKINYPVIVGKQAKEIARRYVQGGYPNLMLVAPDGTIVDHHIGMSKSFLAKAEKIISQ